MSSSRGHGCHKKHNSCSTSRKKAKCCVPPKPDPCCEVQQCPTMGGAMGGGGASGGGGGGPSQSLPADSVLRNQISESFIFGGSQPQQSQNNNNEGGILENGGGANGNRNVEAEVDRLVDCARAYTEKEKFKLKQFYEEEMVRKKKQVINEFQCVMEKEVIAPLKIQLCDYEKQIYQLRQQLEEERRRGQQLQQQLQQQQGQQECLPQQMRSEGTSFLLEDFSVVDKALERARRSNRQLQALIEKEKKRKSYRSMSQVSTMSGGQRLLTPYDSQSRKNSATLGQEMETEGPSDFSMKSSARKSVTYKSDKDGNFENWSEGQSGGAGWTEGQSQSGGGGSRPMSRNGSEARSRPMSRNGSEGQSGTGGWTEGQSGGMDWTEGQSGGAGWTEGQTQSGGGGSRPMSRNGSKGQSGGGGWTEGQSGGGGWTEGQTQSGGGGGSRPMSRSGSEGNRSRGGAEDMREMGFSSGMEGQTYETETEWTEEEGMGSWEDEMRVVDSMLQNENVSQETRMLVTKVKDLTMSLVSTRNFTEEEIRDLIRESERMEEFRRRVSDLEYENEQLRKRIKELEQMLEGMRRENNGGEERGTLVEENMELMRRLQEMEGMRSKGELKEELEQLKEELEEVLEMNEEEKRRSSSERGVLPPGVADEILMREQMMMSEEWTNEVTPDETISRISSRRGSGQSRSPMRGLSREGSLRSGGRRRSSEERRQRDLRRVSTESKGLSARSLGEVTGPYQEEIGLMVERMRELEDQMRAMTELEQKLKEMEAQGREMEELRGRIRELEGLLEEERAKECPVCPPPDLTELEAKKKRVEELERTLEAIKNELEDYRKRMMDLEGVNEELSRSVAGFKMIEQKHSELQTLHAQVLEEKRRRSLEAKSLLGEKGRLETELDGALKELENTKNLVLNSKEMVHELEGRVRGLENEVRELRMKLEQSEGECEELRRRLREKEAELEDLRGRIEALNDEARIARRKMEEVMEAKRELEGMLDGERRRWEQEKDELERRLKEEMRRCNEACDMLSKKGQCVLEHEKRCAKVTTEMEKDNGALREKLRELEEQLEGNRREMERKAREMQGEMEGFKKRAEGRQRELEELQKIEETCALNNGQNSSSYLPSPVYSLPSLPTPSQIDNRRGGPSEECELVKGQIEELKRQRQELEGDLEGRMDQVNRINRQLEDMEAKDRQLKKDKERACRDD